MDLSASGSKVLESGKVSDENPFKAWFEFYAKDEATACLPTYFELLKHIVASYQKIRKRKSFESFGKLSA